MSVHEIFSKKDQFGKEPEIYKYDELPFNLRVQIHHILEDTIGLDSYGNDAQQVYVYVHKILIREYGVFSLGYSGNEKNDLLQYLLKSDNVERVLDVIQLLFKIIERYIKKQHRWHRKRDRY